MTVSRKSLSSFSRRLAGSAALLGTVLAATSAQAAMVSVRVTVENTAPANGVAFAPLHVGFGQGLFDSFNINQVAGAGIVSIAEGGSGSVWQPDFAAAEPMATRGTIGGALLAGATASGDFVVNTALNQFFTFATMVIPSNDLFLGNDNPMAFHLFDASGNLLLNQINQAASQIWDANSEVADPLAAAFLAVGNNSLRTPENGTVAFDFSELNAYNGFTTAAGYVFNNNLSASTPIYRIGFQVLNNNVPEPASAGLVMLALGLMGGARKLRRS